jgi:hypothetical protein
MNEKELERLVYRARVEYWKPSCVPSSLDITLEDWRRVVETLWKEWDSAHTTVEEVRELLPDNHGAMIFNDGSGYVRKRCEDACLAGWSYQVDMFPAIKSLTQPTREEDLETLAAYASNVLEPSAECGPGFVEALAARARMKAREAK